MPRPLTPKVEECLQHARVARAEGFAYMSYEVTPDGGRTVTYGMANMANANMANNVSEVTPLSSWKAKRDDP